MKILQTPHCKSFGIFTFTIQCCHLLHSLFVKIKYILINIQTDISLLSLPLPCFDLKTKVIDQLCNNCNRSELKWLACMIQILFHFDIQAMKFYPCRFGMSFELEASHLGFAEVAHCCFLNDS